MPAMKTFPLLVLTLLLIGCSKTPETLVTEGYDEQQMEAAMARARAEVDVFLAALAEGNGEDFSVKAPITDENGTEHFWITDISYSDGAFTGLIGNDPGIVENVSFGQEWTIKRDEISDWMYTRDEKIHGGYTIDPLLSTMSPEEAEEMRQRLVR
jgi:uncharacterized protein YegJ (DUF2314 family)